MQRTFYMYEHPERGPDTQWNSIHALAYDIAAAALLLMSCCVREFSKK